MFQVIDNQTGNCIATASTIKRARAKRDRLDMIYGACRYSVSREPVASAVVVRQEMPSFYGITR